MEDLSLTRPRCTDGLLLSPMLVSRPMDGVLQEAEIKQPLLKEAVQTTAMGRLAAWPGSSQCQLGHCGARAAGQGFACSL